MHEYEHTQPGTLGRIWLSIWGLVFGCSSVAKWVAGDSTSAMVFLAIAVFLGAIFAMLYSLTVNVSKNEIKVVFGMGVYGKTFLVDHIRNASVVRTRWYHGWGIKKIRGGWLFNVSGFDAIELVFKNGSKARVGTDEPDALLAAIRKVID